MSAGNSWFDGLHLADSAAYAVAEVLRADADFSDAKVERLVGADARNGHVGLVGVQAGEKKWVVMVVEVEDE